MRKNLLLLFAAILVFGTVQAQERYADEIFSQVTLTSNVTFGNNYNFLLDPSNPFIAPMPMNVYEGTGDTATDRACMVVLHTGNFLPKYFNGSASGNNLDSNIVEICNQFAKRGYLVVAPNYRLGWDPLNDTADVRRGTLLNAVYRALHDAKTCVRYMKSEATTYGIDAEKVILYGQGSGGYVSMAYVTLDRMAELEIQKFTDVSGNLYVDTSLVGQIDGSGGLVNNYEYGAYSNDVLCAINAGGALGDSSWLEPGEAPIISFHVPTDPFAPFEQGIVVVPTTNENVVDVVGSNWVVRNANSNGNNDLLGGPYSDPYSMAADAAIAALGQTPSEYEGLFPFHRAVPTPPGSPFPIFPESSPWDWWDQATVEAQANSLGLDGAAIHNNGLLTNPDMSSTKARLYIDTIMGYLAPRLIATMTTVGIEDHSDAVTNNTFVYPNPATSDLTVKVNGFKMTAIEIYGMNGQLVRTEANLNSGRADLSVDGLSNGLYLLKIITEEGFATKRVAVQ